MAISKEKRHLFSWSFRQAIMRLSERNRILKFLYRISKDNSIEVNRIKFRVSFKQNLDREIACL